MANPKLEAIVEKLRVLTPEDSELLKEMFGDGYSSVHPSIPALERDCLREGYFKEYRQLTALTGHNLSVTDIEKVELELVVAGEAKRFNDCYLETTMGGF